MKKISMLFIIAGILAAFFLVLSSPGKWIINLAVLLLISSILLIFRKQHSFWLPTICFCIYSVLAIWGLLEHAGSLLTISGGLFAFITWELIVFQNDLHGNLQTKGIDQLINQHIRVLLPIILAAWLVSLLFLNIQFKLPFMVILLAGGLGIFGFFRFYRTSSNQ